MTGLGASVTGLGVHCLFHVSACVCLSCSHAMQMSPLWLWCLLPASKGAAWHPKDQWGEGRRKTTRRWCWKHSRLLAESEDQRPSCSAPREPTQAHQKGGPLILTGCRQRQRAPHSADPWSPAHQLFSGGCQFSLSQESPAAMLVPS